MRPTTVPEFLLFYPNMNDARIFEWFVLVNGSYKKTSPIKGRYASRTVPGLVLELLPRAEWRRSRKCRIFFKNVPILASEDEHHARLDAVDAKVGAQSLTEIGYNRAATARDERDKERLRADDEKQRADDALQLAENEKQRAEDEKQRTEESWQCVENERRRANKEYQTRIELERRIAELERSR